jgi:hypothetical protein
LAPRFNASFKLASTDYSYMVQKLFHRSENRAVIRICIVSRACSGSRLKLEA